MLLIIIKIVYFSKWLVLSTREQSSYQNIDFSVKGNVDATRKILKYIENDELYITIYELNWNGLL